MKVENYFGEEVSIPDEIYSMAEDSDQVICRVSMGGGWIYLRQRSGRCMRRNEHDPRPFVVAYGCHNRKTGNLEYSDITFHALMGGEFGGFSQVGRLLERYSKGTL